MSFPETSPLGPRRVTGRILPRPGGSNDKPISARIVERILGVRPQHQPGPAPQRHGRGVPRLSVLSDGSPRCTACLACAAVCPTHCIRIGAVSRKPAPKGASDATAGRFEIDGLSCVTCGLCVEACADQAIFMDTSVALSPSGDRNAFRLELEDLLTSN